MKQDYPWFSEYKVFGIPKTLAPYPDQPVHNLLDRAARKYPAMGLVQHDHMVTYPQVKDQADRLATALAGLGLAQGDRVATLLPTCINFAVADYGIGKAGCVHIPASSLEPIPTLEHKFSSGSPKVLICLEDFLETAKKLQKATNIQTIMVARLEDYSATPPPLGNLGAPNIVWMADCIAKNPAKPPKLYFDVDKDLETLLFTGGTTGLPKGCMLTHRGTYANALQNAAVMGGASRLMAGAASALLGLPFFHSYGHIILHTMTYLGMNMLLVPDSRDTDSMVSMMQKYRPVLQFGVPTQFMKLAGEKIDGSGILGMSGSAPLPQSTQKEFEKSAGGGIMEGYGLSEMGPVTHLNTSFLLRIMGGRIPARISNRALGLPLVVPVANRALRFVGPRAVGWTLGKGLKALVGLTAGKKSGPKNEKRGTAGIPYPDTEIKLVEVETGRTLSLADIRAGKQGELLMRGPQRMLGYWPDPGTGMDEEGFIHTSDVVRVDDRGYFYIVDRTKDMIIVSGFKVYSRELDDHLMDHPDIEIGATVGVDDPDREGSERVAVYVQPAPGKKGEITEDQVRAYLKERVARYAVPKFVKIVDEIPLTEVHKVNKKVLREQAKTDFAK